MFIERILCPTDFSECSRRAIDCAAAVARAYGARVTVLHVFAGAPVVDLVPGLGAGSLPPAGLSEQNRRDLLTEMERFARPAGADVPMDFVIQEAADARREVLAQVDALHADLLVMGSHGRSGFDRIVLGSVTERIVRRASCPVMVVPPHAGMRAPAVPFHRIVCGIDFSEGSARGLAYALALARDGQAEVLFVHAIERFAELELAEERAWESVRVADVRAAAEAASLRRLQALVPPEAPAYCSVQPRVLDGRAHRAILRLAAEEAADLIVMGVQGRGAMDLLMFGSNTQEVLRGAGCPVLTVRH